MEERPMTGYCTRSLGVLPFWASLAVGFLHGKLSKLSPERLSVGLLCEKILACLHSWNA
jgi:hypothetical protein